MAEYTKLSNAQIEEIIGLYGISDILSILPMGHGISNTNYRVVTANESYLLKVSNDKNSDELIAEQKLLHIIRQWGFLFSILPLQLPDQTFVYQHGEYYGAVYPFIEGSPPEINEDNLSEIGRAMAQLHLASEDKDLQGIRAHTEVGFNLLSIENYIVEENPPADFKQAFERVYPDGVEHLLDLLLYEQLPKGVIHADLYYDNTLFRDDHLVAVLDFEQAGVGTYLFDIGVCISGSCLNSEGQIDIDLVNAFILGYQQFRELEELELKHLKDTIIIGLFSIARWRISRFVEKKIAEGKEDSYKELIKRAVEFNQSVKKV